MPLFSFRYFAALVVVFIHSGILFGQSQPIKGTIVLNDGTVQNGIHELKSNYQNSRAISFISEDSVTRIYHPFEIESYQVDGGKYYVSKEIEIEGETHQVFLEYLVKGIVSLYFLQERHMDYYFMEKEGNLYPLSNATRIVTKEVDLDPNGRTQEYSTNTFQYKGALRFLFNDSPRVFSQVTNLPFEFESFVDITKDYHNSVCKDYECIDFTTSKIADYLFIEPVLLYGLSNISLTNHEGSLKDGSIEAGLYSRFRLKKSDYQSLLVGLVFSHYTFKGDYNDALYLDVRYGSIRIPMLYEWVLKRQFGSPYIQFGLSTAYVPIIEQFVLGDRTVPDVSKERKLEYGLNLGIGWKIELEEKNSLSIRLDSDVRTPAVQTNGFFDRKQLFTSRLGVSYSFKVR